MADAPRPVAPRARVLVADDNAVNRLVTQAMLHRLGADCVAVEDGCQAVKVATSSRFDLVFMDLHMPVLDGLAATQRVRQIERRQGLPRTPIVAVTARREHEAGEACREAGMDGFIGKPYSLSTLAQCLASVLQRAGPG